MASAEVGKRAVLQLLWSMPFLVRFIQGAYDKTLQVFYKLSLCDFGSFAVYLSRHVDSMQAPDVSSRNDSDSQAHLPRNLMVYVRENRAATCVQ